MKDDKSWESWHADSPQDTAWELWTKGIIANDQAIAEARRLDKEDFAEVLRAALETISEGGLSVEEMQGTACEALYQYSLLCSV